MKALILAAGQGDRLEHLTRDQPKALVKVGGTELVSHQLRFLNAPRIQTIGIVAGYQALPLVSFIKGQHTPIHLFQNPQFKQGSILTLKAALSFLDDDFLLMNVDHIYPQRMLESILKQAKGITACCDFDRPLIADDMKIKRNAHGHVAKIHKELKEYDGGYIGMTLCQRSKLSVYQRAIEATLEMQGAKASVEMILAELAGQGEPIHIADTSGIRWLEVDTLADLKNAEETLKKYPDFLK